MKGCDEAPKKLSIRSNIYPLLLFEYFFNSKYYEKCWTFTKIINLRKKLISNKKPFNPVDPKIKSNWLKICDNDNVT